MSIEVLLTLQVYSLSHILFIFIASCIFMSRTSARNKCLFEGILPLILCR